jgi:hypothetical protein
MKWSNVRSRHAVGVPPLNDVTALNQRSNEEIEGVNVLIQELKS